MTIMDVIFPQKNPFVQVTIPFVWSQSGELHPQNKKKRKEERKRTMGKMEEHVY